jgi:hypothetical protein
MQPLPYRGVFKRRSVVFERTPMERVGPGLMDEQIRQQVGHARF